jgi:hypothetical protein
MCIPSELRRSDIDISPTDFQTIFDSVSTKISHLWCLKMHSNSFSTKISHFWCLQIRSNSFSTKISHLWCLKIRSKKAIFPTFCISQKYHRYKAYIIHSNRYFSSYSISNFCKKSRYSSLKLFSL